MLTCDSDLRSTRICHTRPACGAASPWTPSPPCLTLTPVTPSDHYHSSQLDIVQVVIEYHAKVCVCVPGYLRDLCAPFIGKSFTGAGSGLRERVWAGAGGGAASADRAERGVRSGGWGRDTPLPGPGQLRPLTLTSLLQNAFLYTIITYISRHEE